MRYQNDNLTNGKECLATDTMIQSERYLLLSARKFCHPARLLLLPLLAVLLLCALIVLPLRLKVGASPFLLRLCRLPCSLRGAQLLGELKEEKVIVCLMMIQI